MTDPKNRAERLESPLEPDAERLAALLDGRLDERRRAEAVARLASSDDEFEAFVDALAVTRELEAEDAAAGVTPLRPRARQRWWQRPGGHWAAIAAVLVGLALLPVLWTRSRGPEMDDPGRYAALLEPAQAGLPAGWDESPWGTTRGPADPLTLDARAVRLGARITDLEVAVAARDPGVREISAEIVMLLGEVPAGSAVATYYRDIGDRAGETPEQLQPTMKRGRLAAVALLGDDMVALGAWAQAARLAAARRNAQFFRTGETRAMLARAAELPLQGVARTAVQRIRRADVGGGAPDWGSLEKESAILLQALGS